MLLAFLFEVITSFIGSYLLYLYLKKQGVIAA